VAYFETRLITRHFVQSLATVSGATTYYTRANVRFCQAFASAGISCYTCALIAPDQNEKAAFSGAAVSCSLQIRLDKPQGVYTSSCVFYQPLPRSVCWSSGRSANGGDVKRDTLARVFELFRFPGGSRISPGNSHICPALLSNPGGFPVPVRDKPGGQLRRSVLFPLYRFGAILRPVRRLERCQNVDYK